MNKYALLPLIGFACFVLIAHAQSNPPLRLAQTIPMPGVEGRIDHLSIDVTGQRVFVAALGNNTAEVIDLVQGKRTRSIPGLKEPQGVVYIPDLDQIIVANGDDGTVRTIDAKSFMTVSNLMVGGDADNVRYDSNTGRIVVGYGDGALAFIDSKAPKLLGTTKLAAHPESFQLGSNHLYAPFKP